MDYSTRIEIESLARELRGKAGVTRVPVEVDILDRYCEVTREEYSFSNHPSVAEKLLRLARDAAKKGSLFLEKVIGFYFAEDRRVILNLDAGEKVRRWGHAHELGHAVLDHASQGVYCVSQFDLLRDVSSSVILAAEEEREANFFAARLLLPEKEWARSVQEEVSLSIEGKRIGELFGVSVSVALRELVSRSRVPRCLIALPRKRGHRPVAVGGITRSDKWAELFTPAAEARLQTELLYLGEIGMPRLFNVSLGKKGTARIQTDLVYEGGCFLVVCEINAFKSNGES